MSTATLTLIDEEDGFNMVVHYEGGFNALSPSHQHIEAMILSMGELAEPVGEAKHFASEEEMQAAMGDKE